METFQTESLEEVCGELYLPYQSTFRLGLRRGFRDFKFRASNRSPEDLSHFWYLLYSLESEIGIDESFMCSQAAGYLLGYLRGILKEKL